jgi:L-asparaginase II
VAVVDASGQLSHGFGEPEIASLTRSCIKPFQTLALLTSGAADALALTPEEIAIACASHSGTDEHVRVARGLLEKAGATPEDLQCGAQMPIGLRNAGIPALAGEDKDVLRNACSGKHAGFLALSRHLDRPFAEYLDARGEVQSFVREELARALELDPEQLPWGIDGCSAPNYAVPLVALARGILRVANPSLADPTLRPALERIRSAMLSHPLLVSGERRLDFELASAFPGELVCKGGAQAIELIGVSEPPRGIAVKIHDGSDRALPAICLRVLDQLGVRARETNALAHHRRPTITNHRKLVTGELVATLELEKR